MASDHALRLGKLLGNLQSLEVLLRLYLQKASPTSKPGKSKKLSYWELGEGDEVDEDEFTNFDSLGQLIKKYNDQIAQTEPTLSVDMQIVDIRNLLVHGRVAGTGEDTTTLKILKFTKPNSGKAVVTASVLMEERWFDTNIALCRNQINSVATALNKQS